MKKTDSQFDLDNCATFPSHLRTSYEWNLAASYRVNGLDRYPSHSGRPVTRGQRREDEQHFAVHHFKPLIVRGEEDDPARTAFIKTLLKRRKP